MSFLENSRDLASVSVSSRVLRGAAESNWRRLEDHAKSLVRDSVAEVDFRREGMVNLFEHVDECFVGSSFLT